MLENETNKSKRAQETICFSVAIMVPIFVPLFVTNAMTLSINPKDYNKFFTYSMVTLILSTMNNITVTWHGCQEELTNEITKPKVSLSLCDIHKWNVVVQIMHWTNARWIRYGIIK